MRSTQELSREQEQRALEIHRKSVFINLCDSTNLGNFDEIYMQKLTEGEVTSVAVTCFAYKENFCDAVKSVNEWRTKCAGLGKAFVATSAEDIEKAKRDGKIAILPASQNTEQVENDLGNLDVFCRLGVGIMGLTYQRKNQMGDGLGERTNSGLSKLGTQAIEAMNRLGIVIDLSHCGVATSMEAMEMSKDPVMFTHSTVRGLCNNIRNMTYEQIKALAENDGVVGILALSCFLTDKGEQVGSTMDDYLNHIDYVSDLVGVDHVGVGLDLGDRSRPEGFLAFRLKFPEFPPLDELIRKGIYFPKELGSAATLSAITKGLVARGYSDEDIQKILGKNALRVFKRVWRQ